MAATVHISLVQFNTTAGLGTSLDVPNGTPIGTPEIKTTTGSSQAATLTADTTTLGGISPSRVAWRIAVVGAAGTELVYAAFGSTPTAAAGTGFLCPSGTISYYGVSAVGEDCAVIGPA